MGMGVILVIFFRGERTEYISQRESMAIVSLGWIAVGVFAALPFYLGNVFPRLRTRFLNPCPVSPPPEPR
jgi:trk system potassium uptake protein